MLYTNKKTKKHTDTTGLHMHILIVHLLAIACDYRVKYKRLCPDFQQYEPISKVGYFEIGFCRKKKVSVERKPVWALRGSNPRHSGCKPDARTS